MDDKRVSERQHQILTLLAILKLADWELLESCLGVPIRTAEFESIKRHPLVQDGSNNQLMLAPNYGQQLLTGLEKTNLSDFRQLHDQAIAILIPRLQIGETQYESSFMAVFSRLANSLLSDQPDSLIQLMGKVQDVPLLKPSHKQQFMLFEGIALRRSGKFADSLAVLTQLLAQTELDRTVYGRALNARATCYWHLGQPEKAFNDYNESLSVFRALNFPLREGISLLNIGVLAYELQDYANAEQTLHQAMQIFKRLDEPARVATVQNEIGLVYRDLGRWSEAMEYFDKFVWQRRISGDQEQAGIGLNNIGEILLFQGDFEKAATNFNAALACMTTPVYRFDIHLNIGLAKQAIGQWEEAKKSFTNALELAQEINRREALPHVYYRLGDLYKTAANHDKAINQFTLAAKIIEATREPIRDEKIKISLLGRWQQVYETLVLQYLDLGRIEKAFNWAERARARAFAETVVGRQGTVDVVTADELQSALPTGDAVLCFFTTGVLERDIPMLKAIPKDNPLRCHLLTPARTILFIITRDNITFYDCPIDPNQLTTTSRRGNDPQRFLNPRILPRLSQVLLGEVGDFLSSNNLYLAPHGPLHHVPFGALHDADSRFLLRSDGPLLNYTPSSSILLHHGLANKNKPGNLQVGLAIAHEGGGNGRILPYVKAEAAAICETTGGTVWTGDKTQLREEAAHQQWLHFACHGWFDQERPLESYLEIGHGNHLTAQEVIESWQINAQLVVLSACQTGVRKVLRSDEPMGLIRAFLYAGAQTVLATHWPVEDLPTYLLMTRFYRIWQQQKITSFSHVMREVQVWLRELTLHELTELLKNEKHVPINWKANLPFGLQLTDRPFADPRHWATFMIFGS